MNRLTLLDRIHKKATKYAEDWAKKCTDYEFEEYYERYVNIEFKKLEGALKLNDRLENLLTQYNITSKQVEKLDGDFMWITLRPSDEHIDRFNDFKDLVNNKYLTRSCFLEYVMSWEQKGETPETMGSGYHAHILARVPSWLKKTQMLKDTKSTFNKFLNGYVPEAFVQIEYVRTTEHFNNINAYLRGYKLDKFKEQACSMDTPWRNKNGLQITYGDLKWAGESCSSKSEAT